ncbi:hypothetical protein CLOM_g11388 [Closterium sp. NIES-68]|nr:hypothetical protein CLOM_g11388 [Closterium sp. NIES-68]GJP79508.1 hypothetical protein CLOP_g9736 [Closterium sp. NIES-67]
MSYRRILLPEPPPVIGSAGAPEIFEQGGTAAVIRRAVILGNGHPGSEHQSLGLVRALGLGGSMEVQRVVRPKAGLHRWLRWLPIEAHQKLDAYLSVRLANFFQTISAVVLRLALLPPPRLSLPAPASTASGAAATSTSTSTSTAAPAAAAPAAAGAARTATAAATAAAARTAAAGAAAAYADVWSEPGAGAAAASNSNHQSPMFVNGILGSAGKPSDIIGSSTNARNGTTANSTLANGTLSASYHTSDPNFPPNGVTQNTPKPVLLPRSSSSSVHRPRILSEPSTSAFLPAAAPADPAAIAAEANETLESEGPLLVVAAGRDTAAAAAEVKRLAPHSTLVVQIQHPRNDLHQYDLVVAPLHDFYGLTAAAGREVHPWILKWIAPAPPTKNVVLTTGALHIAEPTLLRSAAATWHSLSEFPKPLVVVNIGGPTRHCSYRPDLIGQLALTLKEMLRDCQGSLSVSFSRRTPVAMQRVLRHELKDQDAVYIWDGQGLDPHLGNLAWADAFIITADSVSMISEACSTGKPVYVVGGEHCKWKIAEFHRTLQHRGAIRPFNDNVNLASTWSYPPLTDNVDVATRVRAEVAKRGWVLHPP